MPREPIQGLLLEALRDFETQNDDNCLNREFYRGRVSAHVRGICRITGLSRTTVKAWLEYGLELRAEGQTVPHPMLFAATLVRS